jgi:hypothetical protein
MPIRRLNKVCLKDDGMSEIAGQLQLLGLQETLRRAADSESTPAKRARAMRRVETVHEMLSVLPGPDDLGFLHSGLCQTFLPHSKPQKNSTIWRRTSGRFSLIVTPGVIDQTKPETRHRQPTQQEIEEQLYVGVPFGARARLILIHLQTEGVKSRFVSLGPSLSAFLRSLGLPVTGGARGTLTSIKEQSLRIATCNFTMQWDSGESGTVDRLQVKNTKIVKGLEMWNARAGDGWNGIVELSEDFYHHLCEHAVPLDKRALHSLSGNSLGLDLYALFAYRLPRLKAPVHIRWAGLAEQFGADYSDKHMLARRIRDTLPAVLDHYPQARVDVLSTGLTLHPSTPAVPRTVVNGYRLIEDGSSS